MNAAAAELDRARFDEARYRDLIERGLTTRAAYVAQRTTVKTSQSRLDQATADLRLSEQQLGYATLRAEQDGVVTRMLAEAGAVVAAGQAVVSVARPSELEAVFDVPDSRIDEIRSASAVSSRYMDDPATQYPARRARNLAERRSGHAHLRGQDPLQNPPANLWLGMTVTVTVARDGGTPSIALPATALFQQERAPAVWVVQRRRTLDCDRCRWRATNPTPCTSRRACSRATASLRQACTSLAAGQSVRLMNEVQS